MPKSPKKRRSFVFSFRFTMTLILTFGLFAAAVSYVHIRALVSAYHDAYGEKVTTVVRAAAEKQSAKTLQKYIDIISNEADFAARQKRFMEAQAVVRDLEAENQINSDSYKALVAEIERYFAHFEKTYYDVQYRETAAALEDLRVSSGVDRLYVFADLPDSDYFVHLFSLSSSDQQESPGYKEGLGSGRPKTGYQNERNLFYEIANDTPSVSSVPSDISGETIFYAYAPISDADGITIAVVGAEIHMTQMQNTLRRSIIESSVIICILLLVALLFFCLFINKSILSPIDHIAKGLQSLNDDSPFDSRKTGKITKRRDEIGALAFSVNEFISNHQTLLRNTELVFSNTAAGYLDRRIEVGVLSPHVRRVLGKTNKTMDLVTQYLDSLPECFIILDDRLGLTYSNQSYQFLQNRIMGTSLWRLIIDGISEKYEIPITNTSELEKAMPYQASEILWLDLNKTDRRCFSILTKRPSGTEGMILIIASDITDLMVARDRANLANLSKSNFLSRVSHELRTPMNAVIGLSNLLLRDSADPKKTTQRLKKIVLTSEHLMSIINDIVDMTKIEANQIEISNKPFVMRQLVQHCYDMLSYQADEKGIDMSLHIPADTPRTLVGDSARMCQALINLISNAIKFTDPGGKVEICLEIRDSTDDSITVAFIIRDTGVGISQEQLDKIFIPFQDTDYLSRRFQGLGLSLPITNHIVQKMGGHIDVDSNPGEGSVFTVVIAFKRAPEYDLPIQTARSDVPRHALADLCMLVVDDIEINRMLVYEVFSRFDMHIEEASDGAEALEKFENSPDGYYNIIFMDIQMPNMDGYEATRRIRALNRIDAPLVPIIAMTANAMKEDVAHALECGLNAHMSKPINFTECEHTVYRFCISKKD